MANRSVVIKASLQVAGIVSGARTAATALKDLGDKGLSWVGKNEQHINQLSNGLGKVGIAAVAGVGLAVKKFADFDQQMSFVAATGDDARDSIDALREAAIEAGQRTAFSATEAAQGIEELAKAGVSAQDVLAGGLDGALDLAAAGGISVAEAAETAATAMTQFGLSGDKVTHLADLLAAGAGKAQGGVSDLGMALKQSGLVADQTGLSIEETVGGLTAFASAGLLGSDAGTSFKTMLQRLTPTSNEAADEMRHLGISAYDSQGNFIGLAQFAGNLQAAMKNLTPEARNAALATIFGSDAVRAASVIYEQGEAGIQKWIGAVDDQGYAAETAATRLDNLKGDLEQLGGAFETALIGAGSGANGPLRGLVQGVTDVVNKFNDMPPAAQSATLAIIGGGGLVALGIAGLGKLAVSVSNTRDALSNLGISTDGLKGKIGKLVGAGVGIAAAWQLSDIIQDVTGLAVKVDDLQGEIDRFNLRGTMGSELEKVFGENFDDAGDVIHDFNDTLSGLARSVTDFNWSNVRDGLKGVDGDLAEMVAGGKLQEASDFFWAIADAAQAQGTSLSEVQQAFPKYGEAVLDAAAKSAEAGDVAFGLAGGIAATGSAAGGVQDPIDGLNDNLDEAALAAQSAADNLAAYIKQISIATDPVFALNDAVLSVTDAQKNYDEVMADNKHTQEEAEQAAFDLAEAVANLETKALSGDLSFEAFSGKLDQWVKQGAVTKSQAAAIKARIQDLTGAAKDYKGNYDATLKAKDNASGTIDLVKSKADKLDGTSSTVTITTFHDYVNRIFDQYQQGPHLASGGLVPGYASGGAFQDRPLGLLSGPGTGTSDSILARVSKGEYVTRKAAVDKYGVGFMDAVNNGRLQTMGAGTAAQITGHVTVGFDFTNAQSDFARFFQKAVRTGEIRVTTGAR